MPTLKKRLNITLSPTAEEALTRIAKRDNIPAATRAAQLLEIALEMEEDEIMESVATARMQKKSPTVSHATAWK